MLVGRGRQQIIPATEEEKLVLLVEPEAMCSESMKIAVYRSTLFSLANKAIAGTEYEKCFKHWQDFYPCVSAYNLTYL